MNRKTVLTQWRHGTTMLEDYSTTILEVVGTYDHDYRGVHLLVGVFTKEQEDKNYDWRGYELWHLRVDDTFGLVGQWPERELGNPPFQEVGQVIQEWYNTYVLNNN